MKDRIENTLRLSPMHWALGLCSILIFLVVNNAKLSYADSDARFSLLTSQALLENGSLQLDPYMYSFDLAKENNGHFWMVHSQGKEADLHLYYDYPIGTPLLSVPFVAFARATGLNMVKLADDMWLQRQMVSGLAVLLFLLLFRLARRTLDDWTSLAFALLIWAGTSLASTLGTALWSQGFQVVFILLVLDELWALHLGQRAEVRGGYLGILLFAGYLCRPTSVWLVILLLAYLAFADRKAMLRLLVMFGIGFGAFMLWSWNEFGEILPRYYNPSAWRKDPETWAHLLPIWLGPARGFFSFSPVFLLAFLGFLFASFRKQILPYLVIAWWLALSWTIINGQSPWGGWCYGPRFFTELVPGFALLLLMLAQTANDWFPQAKRRLLLPFLFLSAFGIWVNLYQGLYNTATKDWNDQPNIDKAWQQRRSDWSDPQFLALDFKNARRAKIRQLSDQLASQLKGLPDGAAILYEQPDPELADIFAKWTQSNHFGAGYKLFNSVYAFHLSGEASALVYLPQAPAFKALGNLSLEEEAGHTEEGLADFLTRCQPFRLVISAKDEASYQLSDETKAKLRSMGSQIDSLKMRDSYLAVIENGQLLFEEQGQHALHHEMKGKYRLEASSQGLFVGNQSSIMVAGTEYSPNLRGMNVVAIDTNGKVQEVANFDTHALDKARRLWLPCRIKR